MKTRIILGIILLICLVTLIYINNKNCVVYYYTVQETLSKKQELEGKEIRVSGRIKADSILPDMESSILQCSLSDKDGHVLKVLFADNSLAQKIKAGSDILIEGQIDEDGNLIATGIITKCPSKYN